ncbi:hypothetical protein Syun_000379 [Stephania yunnanensis]|uniref:Uncharacterized protein n=1 Tax=Stephania yunnanensis TaxID=152371 RepID=A0AAP0LFW0_9MAGN
MRVSFSSFIRRSLICVLPEIARFIYKPQIKPTCVTSVSILLSLLSCLILSSICDITNFIACGSSASLPNTNLTCWLFRLLSLAALGLFWELDMTSLGVSSSEGTTGAKPLPAETVTVACPDHLVLADLPIEMNVLLMKIFDSSCYLDYVKGAARCSKAHVKLASHPFPSFVNQASMTTCIEDSYECDAIGSYPFFQHLIKQIELGFIVLSVIPCGLVALDHWSPAVKGQGMISFIHLAKNVKAAELGFYEDVILDTCCQNIASDDELWCHVVEMSVLLLTLIQRKNPHSPWFEKIMNEMLGHLERQARNKGRYTAWLELIDPVFECMGLVLLAHFRRIFPLLLHWVHSDDDKIVLLVLEKILIIIKLTWIRNSPYVGRLIDELIVTYKEASLRRQREDIRNKVLQILILLQKCKGLQFEAAWNKHKYDPNLAALAPAFCTESTPVV